MPLECQTRLVLVHHVPALLVYPFQPIGNVHHVVTREPLDKGRHGETIVQRTLRNAFQDALVDQVRQTEGQAVFDVILLFITPLSRLGGIEWYRSRVWAGVRGYCTHMFLAVWER